MTEYLSYIFICTMLREILYVAVTVKNNTFKFKTLKKRLSQRLVAVQEIDLSVGKAHNTLWVL